MPSSSEQRKQHQQRRQHHRRPRHEPQPHLLLLPDQMYGEEESKLNTSAGNVNSYEEEDERSSPASMSSSSSGFEEGRAGGANADHYAREMKKLLKSLEVTFEDQNNKPGNGKQPLVVRDAARRRKRQQHKGLLVQQQQHSSGSSSKRSASLDRGGDPTPGLRRVVVAPGGARNRSSDRVVSKVLLWSDHHPVEQIGSRIVQSVEFEEEEVGQAPARIGPLKAISTRDFLQKRTSPPDPGLLKTGRTLSHRRFLLVPT